MSDTLPSLLEACKRLLSCPDLNLEELEAATRDAISVAQGAVHRAEAAPEADERDDEVRALANEDPRVNDGELEIDEDAVVSHGGDNGAYVQAWLWVSFEGTSLDKNAAADEDPTDGDHPVADAP